MNLENHHLFLVGELTLSFVFSLFLSRSFISFTSKKSLSNRFLKPFLGPKRLQVFIWFLIQILALALFDKLVPTESHWIKTSVVALGGINLVSWFALAYHASTSLLIILLIACPLLALEVTGLLDPALKSLDGLKVGIGGKDFSILSLLKATLIILISLKGVFFISRKLDEQIEQIPSMQLSMKILVSKIIRVLLISFSISFGLSLVGIDNSAFGFFAGALGVGVGLGLQNVFSNFFSGLILLSDRSIKIGDVIALEEGGKIGVVHKLNARYVCIRTREGKKHLIPNEKFINNSIENWSYGDTNIRTEVIVHVHFDSDLDHVEKLLLDIAANTKRVLAKPKPTVRVLALVENYAKVSLRVWIADPENGTTEVQSDIFLAIWRSFREHNIRIPYPAAEYYMMDEEFHVQLTRGEGASKISEEESPEIQNV